MDTDLETVSGKVLSGSECKMAAKLICFHRIRIKHCSI